jgi:site-specific recombinase XerC
MQRIAQMACSGDSDERGRGCNCCGTALARRMLKTGAQLPEVQRMLGHSRLSTTEIYLTPSEDDVQAAVERAGL